MGAHRYLVGDEISIPGEDRKWFLLWLRGRTPEGEQIWDAEDELGNTKLIFLR